MNKIINNKIIFVIISILISVIIYCSKVRNDFIFSIDYLLFTIFMFITYFKNEKISYLRYLYLFWILITILLLIFSFNTINIILIIVSALFIVINYFKQNKSKQKKIIIKKDNIVINKKIDNKPKIHLPSNIADAEFEKNIKGLYLNMQNYFSNFDYINLKKILSSNLYEQFNNQMKHLENTNKQPIRKIEKIYDFKINDFDNSTGMVKVSISVIEEKYTEYLDKPEYTRKMIYDSCYELDLIKKDKWIINNLKLLCSHSKRIDS